MKILKKKYFWAQPNYYDLDFWGFLTEGYNR